MVCDSSPVSNHPYSPQVQPCRVKQRATCHSSERPGSSECKRVTKIEKSCSDGSKKDAELKPRKECAFGCELNFGFYTDRDVDSYRAVSMQLCDIEAIELETYVFP
jgi:hypothetical protein